MNGRVERVRASLEEPLLVTAPANVRYLTGLSSSNAALLVEPDRLRLFTDFRYAETAGALEGIEFKKTERNLLKSLAELLTGRIGFEEDALTYAAYRTLAEGGLELVPRQGIVEKLRAVKDEDELAAIARAAAITDAAYEQLARERFVGRTERELAWRMVELFHELGADGPAFDVIVAAGPNGARPHTTPGARKIETGQTVVVDAGCALGGYNSDCTRTFATGPLPEELERAYEVCLQAQEAGVAAARPGVSGADADLAARTVIEEAGFGEAFGHALGHGLGLLVHEAPRLGRESADVLTEGNVVTIEPGIYLSGVGGVRIEDLVVVREGGPDVLSSFPKTLQVLN